MLTPTPNGAVVLILITALTNFSVEPSNTVCSYLPFVSIGKSDSTTTQVTPSSDISTSYENVLVLAALKKASNTIATFLSLVYSPLRSLAGSSKTPLLVDSTLALLLPCIGLRVMLSTEPLPDLIVIAVKGFVSFQSSIATYFFSGL